MKESVKAKLIDLIERYPVLQSSEENILSGYEQLKACYKSGGKLLICGNGGSACDSEHMVAELMKGFLLKRKLSDEEIARLAQNAPDGAREVLSQLEKAFPAISLTSQTSLATSIANDNGNDMIFAQQTFAYGKPGDVLVAFSTSGNSPNVINAVVIAKTLGMHTLGMTGLMGGKLRNLCDICIGVPEALHYKIQDLHVPIYHTLCLMLEQEFFGEVP